MTPVAAEPSLHDAPLAVRSSDSETSTGVFAVVLESLEAAGPGERVTWPFAVPLAVNVNVALTTTRDTTTAVIPVREMLPGASEFPLWSVTVMLAAPPTELIFRSVQPVVVKEMTSPAGSVLTEFWSQGSVMVAAVAGLAMPNPPNPSAIEARAIDKSDVLFKISPRCPFAIGGPGHEWLPLKGYRDTFHPSAGVGNVGTSDEISG